MSDQGCAVVCQVPDLGSAVVCQVPDQGNAVVCQVMDQGSAVVCRVFTQDVESRKCRVMLGFRQRRCFGVLGDG